MYCPICGSEINAGAAFCPMCGVQLQQTNQMPQQNLQTPTPDMNMPKPEIQEIQRTVQIPTPEMNMPRTENVMPQPVVQQEQPMQSQQQVAPKPPKKLGGKSKVPFIIGGVVAGILILAVLLTAVPKLFRTPQRKAIDKTFSAVNKLDMEKLEESFLPKEFLDNGNRIEGNYAYFLIRSMGFTRGLLEADYIKFDQKVAKEIYKSMPEFNPEKYGGIEKYDEMMKGQESSLKAMRGLKVKYKVKEIKKFDQVDLYVRDGLKGILVDNMDDVIVYKDGEESKKLDIDELYIAKVHVDWSYHGCDYGYDKAWWLNKTLRDRALMGKTYKESVEYFKKNDVYMLVYKYEGKWYVKRGPLTPMAAGTYYYE